MNVAKALRDASKVTIYRTAWGGSQNFLGARWVESLVDGSPARFRERVALRLLSLSPHYFYNRDILEEAERNRRSRQVLADTLIVPYLTDSARVLDYGCGPGYLAYAVAAHVAHVDAVDISGGVLACARTLNSRHNITYQTPDEFKQTPGTVDLAYSFAVAQHLRSEVLADVLKTLAARIRPTGLLLLHFAVPTAGAWRTEDEWTKDQSLSGRVKLRYRLNCFGRSVAEMEDVVSASGFTAVEIRSLSGTLTVPGDEDIPQQHLLIARRI